jgi:hypothetical protein
VAERDSFFPLKYDSISKGEEPLAYYHDGPKQRLIVVWVATGSTADFVGHRSNRSTPTVRRSDFDCPTARGSTMAIDDAKASDEGGVPW